MADQRMMPENRECGIRHKFVVKTRDLLPNVYPQEMERLIHWCGVFDAEGMAPVEGGASAGNLSFRSPSGYVITPTRSRLKANLSWKDFIEVVRENWLDYEVHVLGERAPSSDAFLHGRIYARRPDVMAVYHGHDELVLRHADAISRHFDIAVTSEEMVFGTRLDAEETARALGTKDYIIRKGHGFLAVGRTQDRAGELCVAIHRFAASQR